VTYRGGRIDFLNPSVGEMVAREIADCPEYALDLVAAAGRFRQIVTVFELGEQDGRTPVRDILAKNTLTLMKAITSLLRTPHLRWDKKKDGRQIGTFIDLPLEERIEHIGEVAHAFQVAPLRTLFESEIRGLAERYCKGGFDMSYATSLVKAFDKLPQLKAGNGVTLQRELLNGILSDEDSWWADQLNTLIDFSREVSIWSDVDDAKLDEAIAQYGKDGVENEYDNCSDASDYERFRDELDSLGQKLGEPFTSHVGRIEQRLTELSPDEDDERYGGSSWRSSGRHSDGADDTDDAIRGVFGSLLD
jgi:hypothetical protein